MWGILNKRQEGGGTYGRPHTHLLSLCKSKIMPAEGGIRKREPRESRRTLWGISFTDEQQTSRH